MKRFPALLILSAALVFAWSMYATYRSDKRQEYDRRIESLNKQLDFLLKHYSAATVNCFGREPDVYGPWFSDVEPGVDL